MYQDRLGLCFDDADSLNQGFCVGFSSSFPGAHRRSVSAVTHLIRSVVDDEVHDEMHVSLIELDNQLLDILHRPVWGIDVVVV